MTITCASCGKPFLVSASRALTRRYCSHACANAGLHKAKLGTALRHYCPVCGRFARLPYAPQCACGAKADRRYVVPVEVDLEPTEAQQ